MQEELDRSRAVSLAHGALYGDVVFDPKDDGRVWRLADVLQQVHKEAIVDRAVDYYRLNALENVLSKGTVILSVGRESDGNGCYVKVESVNGSSAQGHGCLRCALDELRKQKS